MTKPSTTDLGALLRQAAQQANAGRWSDAAALGEAVLAHWPQDADALHISGMALVRLGRGAEGLARLKKAAVHRPEALDIQINLTSAMMAAGRHEDAAKALKKALRKHPGHAALMFSLAHALRAGGKPGPALDTLRRLDKAHPGDPQVMGALGALLHQTGRLDEALETYEKALAQAPNLPDLLGNLGALLIDRGDPVAAVGVLERLVAGQPGSGAGWFNLGNAKRQAGDRPGAEAAFRKAAELSPRDPSPLNNLANLLLNDPDRLDEARSLLEAALALSPDRAETQAALGKARTALGDIAGGEAAFRRAIALRPDYAEAWRHIAELKTFADPDDPDVAAMEALARSRPAPAVAAQLGFALAKAHEDLGDIDAAWAHLARANAGVRERLAHDVADDLAAFQALAAAFGADRLSGARRTDPAEGPIPIFIVGMPRSGTSLVEQILACHDAVAAGGEREDLRRLVGAKDPATWSDDHLATLGAAYRHAVAPLAGGRRFITDKMPVNARFVGLIALALPEARIIHCRRDPVDTCLACFKQFFAGNPHTFDLTDLGRYHRGQSALMDHWRAALPPDRLLDLDYEALVADQEGESRRLLAHCGLDWTDACLDFHSGGRPVHTASAAQVRQPIYTSAVRRWKRYEKHLGPLLDALGPLVPTD